MHQIYLCTIQTLYWMKIFLYLFIWNENEGRNFLEKKNTWVELSWAFKIYLLIFFLFVLLVCCNISFFIVCTTKTLTQSVLWIKDRRKDTNKQEQNVGQETVNFEFIISIYKIKVERTNDNHKMIVKW